MRVFVTGGTGFVGQDVVRDMLNAGLDPVLLVHEAPPSRRADVEVVHGDVTDRRVLAKGLEGCEAAVHLATPRTPNRSRSELERVHVTGTQALVDAAAEAGVRRLVLASVAGAREDGTPTQSTKREAERIVEESSRVHTILRMTPVVGSGGIVDALRRLLKVLPATPVLGAGDQEVAPVACTDVSRAVVKALQDATDTVHETYCLSGPDTLTYAELVGLLREHFGLDRPTLRVPPKIATASARALGLVPGAPRRADDIVALLDHGVCGDAPGLADLGVDPTSFQEALEQAFGPPHVEASRDRSGGPGMFGPGRP